MPKSQRDQIIDAAVQAGKIRASERDAYARNYDANPQAYRHLLTAAVKDGGLAAGVHKNDAPPGGEEYDTRFLSPSERQRVEAARAAAPKPKPGSRLANAPTQARGRSDLDMSQYDDGHLTAAERATIAAGQAGQVVPGSISGDGPGGSANGSPA